MANADIIGKNISGYLVKEIIGKGSQGETYIVSKGGKKYCMKRFVFVGKDMGVFKKFDLFEREINVLKGMDIDGVPKYINHFSLNGEMFLVMELVQGKDLRKVHFEGGNFGDIQCSKFIEDIGGIVQKLGKRGITHRDINPKNVIWDGERFWLVDFGGVKIGKGEGSTVVGTFGYMGMEQFRGKVERSTDWYGMGMTLVWMLCGKEPEELGYKDNGELDIGKLDLGEFGGRIGGWVKGDWKKRVWDSGIVVSKGTGLKRIKKFHLSRMILWLALGISLFLLTNFVSFLFFALGFMTYLLCIPAMIRNIWDGGVQKTEKEITSAHSGTEKESIKYYKEQTSGWWDESITHGSKDLFKALKKRRDDKDDKFTQSSFTETFKESIQHNLSSLSACVVCGKSFYKDYDTKTCSDECLQKLEENKRIAKMRVKAQDEQYGEFEVQPVRKTFHGHSRMK